MRLQASVWGDRDSPSRDGFVPVWDLGSRVYGRLPYRGGGGGGGGGPLILGNRCRLLMGGLGGVGGGGGGEFGFSVFVFLGGGDLGLRV